MTLLKQRAHEAEWLNLNPDIFWRMVERRAVSSGMPRVSSGLCTLYLFSSNIYGMVDSALNAGVGGGRFSSVFAKGQISHPPSTLLNRLWFQVRIKLLAMFIHCLEREWEVRVFILISEPCEQQRFCTNIYCVALQNMFHALTLCFRLSVGMKWDVSRQKFSRRTFSNHWL